jgi:hypothetical protein
MRIHSVSRSAARRLRASSLLSLLLLLALCLGACSTSSAQTPGQTPSASGSTGGKLTFPTTPPQLRAPDFGSPGQIAPTLKVLPSVAPTLILQFPLVPVSIKNKFPNATALVTVVQGNPDLSVFDTVIVDVQHMPPNIKFTIFFTEIATKPFGHAEYIGDLFTRGDGSGESIFHLITLVAFAADNRHPGTSNDQSGEASGTQLEHMGMWFDTIGAARQVLGDNTIPSTPFDGGHPPLHSGPQAMTDGQSLPVI